MNIETEMIGVHVLLLFTKCTKFYRNKIYGNALTTMVKCKNNIIYLENQRNMKTFTLEKIFNLIKSNISNVSTLVHI